MQDPKLQSDSKQTKNTQTKDEAEQARMREQYELQQRRRSCEGCGERFVD